MRQSDAFLANTTSAHHDLTNQLGAFETSTLPESSRVDPKVTQRASRRMFWAWGLRDLFLVVLFIVQKIKHLLEETVAHFVFGPRRKTWPLFMTIISSLMRDAGMHSSLADISFIRALVGLSSWIPFPPSALVTPVSFRVRYRQLRGLLREFDECEKGGPNFDPGKNSRELTAEWIVDRKMWTNWQKSWKGRRKAKPSDETRGEKVVLYLHGGAYYVATAQSHRLITIAVSRACEARVFALNYRLAPETRFPGPLHDAASAYFRLTDDLGIPPSSILLAGDSAGGGLCLGLLLYLRDNGYPLPNGACLLSPWLDLTMSCESWDSNLPFDVVPVPTAGDPLNPILCYLGAEGLARGFLTHPYASPLFGNLTGLPPLLIQAGEAEVLRDEITLFAFKAKLAGVEVTHEIYEDAIHVFQTFTRLEQTRLAFQNMSRFVSRLSIFEPTASTQLETSRGLSYSTTSNGEKSSVQPPISSSTRAKPHNHPHHRPSFDISPSRWTPTLSSSPSLPLSRPQPSSPLRSSLPPKRPSLMTTSGARSYIRPTPPRMRSRALSHPQIVEIVESYSSSAGRALPVESTSPSVVVTDS